MRITRGVCAAFCAALLVTAPRARAAGPEATQARELAQEAGDLLDAKRYAEALDRVTRAESLYHAPTHELMMGQAQEGLGHPAIALGIYEKLAAEPLPAAAPRAFLDAQQTGKELLRSLLARVPSLLVVVRGLRAGERADVRLDGDPVPLDAGTAKPADPGSHVVVVQVPGRDAVQRSVVLPGKGGVVTLEVSLAPEGAEGPPAAPPPPPSAAATQPAAPAPVQERSGSLVPAFVAFGVGAVGLGVGAVTGVMSLSNVSDLRQRCPSNHCAPAEQSEIDSTKTLGTVSTVGFVVGGVGAAAGAALLLLRGPSREAGGAAQREPHVAPWVALGTAGLEGTF